MSSNAELPQLDFALGGGSAGEDRDVSPPQAKANTFSRRLARKKQDAVDFDRMCAESLRPAKICNARKETR